VTATRAALLAATRACPADDLPRLVFADWLDDHGEPDRAEFVRLHLRLDELLAGLDERKVLRWRLQGRDLPADGPAAAVAARLDALFAARGAGWLGGVPARMGGTGWRVVFRGGFLHTLPCYPDELPAWPARLFAREPVDGLDLWLEWAGERPVDDPVRLAEVAGWAVEPFWRQVRRLRLASEQEDGSAAALLGSPAVSAVEELDVSDLADYSNDRTAWMRFATALAASPHLGRMTDLTLPQYGGDEVLLPLLAADARLPAVRRLTLAMDGMTAAVAEPFARSPLLARLTHLAVHPEEGSAWADVLTAIVRSPNARHLRSLDCDYACVALEPALVALAGSPHMAGLRELRLRCMLDNVGDAVTALARSPYLAGLRVLDVSECNISDRDADALATAPFAPMLAELWLSRTFEEGFTERELPLDRLRAAFGDRLRVRD
jgi:uncharacterized protein (TIGR02996 family)